MASTPSRGRDREGGAESLMPSEEAILSDRKTLTGQIAQAG